MTAWNEDSDPDYTDDQDADEGDSLTHPCPECGTDVYEDAERCPACGEWITRRSSVWQGKPLWWVILGVLGIIAVVLAFSLG